MRAATISIDITAGTAKMNAQLEQCKGALRSFGASGAGAMAPTTVALRELEGNLGNNTRGVARFLAQTLHLGPALQAAFPLIGGIAFAGMIVSLAGKVVDFFKKTEESARKAADAFREVTAPMELSVADLQVHNDKLDNQIAKLLGKHENVFKLQLDEAVAAGKKLGEELDKDISKVDEVIKKESVGWFKQLLGVGGTDELDEYLQKIREALGGTNNPADQLVILNQASAVVKDMIQTANRLAKPTSVSMSASPLSPAEGTFMRPGIDETKSLRALQATNTAIDRMRDLINLQTAAAKKDAETAGLEAGASAAKKYKESVKQADDEIAKAQEKQLTAMQAVDAAEKQRIADLKTEGNYHGILVERIAEEYRIKRENVLNTEAEQSRKLMNESYELQEKIALQDREGLLKYINVQVREGLHLTEEWGKQATKVADEINRINKEAKQDRTAADVHMIGIAGNPSDKTGTLAKQQDVEYAAIMARYYEQMHEWNTVLETKLAIDTRDHAILKLNIEMAKQVAELNPAQHNVKSFFMDMQHNSEEAGEIFYQAMHSALDRVSEDLGKLLTGQIKKGDVGKTFGKTFEGIGESMVTSSVKSLAQQGLGRVGTALGIKLNRTGQSRPTALYVELVNAQGSGGPTVSASPWTSEASSAGGSTQLYGTSIDLKFLQFFRRLLQGAGTSASSTGASAALGTSASSTGTSAASGVGFSSEMGDSEVGGWMASGGDVVPGKIYGWQESGQEYFTPRTSGTVIPASKMGGDTHVWNLDLRGADIGVEGRVRALMSGVQNSAIASAVSATTERSRRMPRR